MENLQIYFYIILLIIYLVARVMKSKDNAKPKSGQPQPTDDTDYKSPERPFSFDDVFKELEKQFGGEEDKPIPHREHYREQQPLKEKLPEPPLSNEYKSLTKADLESTELSKQIGEMGSLLKEDTTKRGSKSEEPSYYAKLFKSGNGARDAFVMGEIFNKKY